MSIHSTLISAVANLNLCTEIKLKVLVCVGPDSTMEVKTLQGVDMENGTVKSVRI